MIQIKKIDHLVLRSDNVAGMVRFYHEVFGCEVERELPAVGLTQLRAGNALIDIVAVNSELGRAGGAPPGPTGNNLDHFCLELEAIGERELREWLEARGVECGPFQTRYGAGGFGPSIYIRDPDGNTVELRPGVE
ncbi:MAG TPA: VOC family protein [Xanthomonadales bacterium]|nr:VOC family protein [Xanthomonadales bacterium]